MAGERYDYPNREALGLDPPWVGAEESGRPSSRATRDAATAARLDDMTKAELLEFAQSLEAKPANNDMTKDELRASIFEKIGR